MLKGVPFFCGFVKLLWVQVFRKEGRGFPEVRGVAVPFAAGFPKLRGHHRPQRTRSESDKCLAICTDFRNEEARSGKNVQFEEI